MSGWDFTQSWHLGVWSWHEYFHLLYDKNLGGWGVWGAGKKLVSEQQNLSSPALSNPQVSGGMVLLKSVGRYFSYKVVLDKLSARLLLKSI